MAAQAARLRDIRGTAEVNPGRGRPRPRRRAVALILAMIAVIVAGTLGYTYLSTQGTSLVIAQNIDDAARARYVAETGMEVALSFVRNSTGWRSAVQNGTWTPAVSFGDGSYTIRFEDGLDANGDGVITVPAEGDGNLADNAGDPATITVTATVGGARCKVTSVVSGSSGGSTEDYGYKTVSGLSADDIDGIQVASRISITRGGPLASLSFYGDGPPSKNFRLALYTDSGGQPGDLVAQTASTDVGSNKAAWHTVAISTPVNVSAGTYWVALCLDHRNMDAFYTTSAGNVRAKAGNAVDAGFSSSWGTSALSFPGALNVYATVGSAGVSVDWKN